MEKFLNVDVLDIMDSITNKVLVRGLYDFWFDKQEIIAAVHDKDLRLSPLIWICHTDGTALYRESDSFRKGTLAYDEVQFYHRDDRPARVPAYYVIEVSGEKQGAIRGNVYAIDSHRYAAFSKQALSQCSAESEIEAALKAALERASRMRQALPKGDLNNHLEKLGQEQIRSEVNRMAALLERIDKPNSSNGLFRVAAVSNRFLAKASRNDTNKFIIALRKALQKPSLFLGYYDSPKVLCVFQPGSERSQQKQSIKAQLAAKPVTGDQHTKPKEQEGR